MRGSEENNPMVVLCFGSDGWKVDFTIQTSKLWFQALWVASVPGSKRIKKVVVLRYLLVRTFQNCRSRDGVKVSKTFSWRAWNSTAEKQGISRNMHKQSEIHWIFASSNLLARPLRSHPFFSWSIKSSLRYRGLVILQSTFARYPNIPTQTPQYRPRSSNGAGQR